MQICTLFNPELSWREQLQPLIGRVEVQKLEMKLKEMNVTNLDSWHISYSLMFPNPSMNKMDHFTDLLRVIGAWPTVSNNREIFKTSTIPLKRIVSFIYFLIVNQCLITQLGIL